ncbi:hypothetical protein OIU76_008772 [Salix suchowensis]|uniref:COACTIVATOR CBP KIX DOMAIN-CONTAINING PROTEIN-RELATED n=3 Tax=Salix TaxID=40685 RepID=A0A9Q0ZSU7_9ROSI|nr:histone acetyltransferase [Salix suchowensis]KAJ6697834.1 COACTIVATOR CBP KIX DOMAIN-CONTAINING PROTEIN-RELATED [Salix purpurea]KAJ6745436.1 COACTIVATOR CBP KIX DOMAIN-CONTAINING PROTEIN-RELATED [Salix koriyanagi]KAJ6330009.1 hypothetical protein OIU76_008772 [Salix suchowensis]KAJ6361347.1 hypothetical protein OIU78_001899 [Salix suchowensis]
MPRPGPRPYECVRRAWHSDRHQPIRGSLIQEIFRLVNEAHGSTTKKNKEWQEKLPVVVLKAEEIMYSKANSEAEYMEPKTLWDRTNDAINTIIRRDESMETGELLQPCIEAALNLGCTPRRASRSQRNCNPSFYLSPTTREPNTLLPGSMHSSIQADHASNSRVLPNYPNMVKPMIMNSTPSGSESQDFAGQINGTSNKFLFIDDNIPLYNVNQCLPLENYRIPSPCSVYPLYYGGCLEPRRGCGALPKTLPGTMEPVEVAAMQNFFPRTEDIPVQICHADHRKDSPLQQQETGCDLSLRLGSLPAPMPSLITKQLTRVNVADPLVPRSSKLREHVNIDVTTKKRKAVLDHHVEDQFYWQQPKLRCNQ